MIQKKNILIIGRHADMLSKFTTLLNQNGYNSIGRLTNEEAILVFQSQKFDAVVIGGGVDSESRFFFHNEFPKINPNIKMIDAHPQTVLIDLKKILSN
jgi:DNA-binding NtrC family response regulator